MPSKILLIQTAFIGDLVLSTPLLKELRRLYPLAQLDLFCRKPLGSLLQAPGLVDQVIEWNKSDKASFKKLSQWVREQEYDLVLCPHPSFRSALLAKSSGALSRIGFKKWWNTWAFTERVPRPKALPEALRQLSLLVHRSEKLKQNLNQQEEALKKRGVTHLDQPGSIDATARVPQWASLSLRDWFDEQTETKTALLERLHLSAPSEAEPWAIIGPGSVWGTKKYPSAYYHEVAQKLTNLGYKVIAMGAPNEKDDCEAVVFGIEGAEMIAGKTNLLESAQLLSLATVLFTNDCGAMHLASLTDTPTVSMFGPTVLSFGYRPWQNQAVVVENKELACRPCHHHGPPTCPLGHHDCMRLLKPEKVLAARLNLGLKK